MGPGVEGLPDGQRVLALGAGLFATHARVRSELVFPIAEDLDAAGLGVAQLTAYCGLHEVARLQAGERV